MRKILYHESQRMLQPSGVIGITLLVFVIEALAILSYQGMLDLDKGTDAVVLSIVTVLMVAIELLALLLRMDVTVTEGGVRVRTIGTRYMSKEEIERIEIRDKVRAVREYGGWGIRLWIHGVGYIAPGSKGGVEIRLSNRRTGILISSRDPEALFEAISAILRGRREDEPQRMELLLPLPIPRFETGDHAPDVLGQLLDLSVRSVDGGGPEAHRIPCIRLSWVGLGIRPEAIGEFDAEHQEDICHLGVGYPLLRDAVGSRQRTGMERIGLLHSAPLLLVIHDIHQTASLHPGQKAVHGGAGDLRIPLTELLHGDAFEPDDIQQYPARAWVDEDRDERIVHVLDRSCIVISSLSTEAHCSDQAPFHLFRAGNIRVQWSRICSSVMPAWGARGTQSSMNSSMVTSCRNLPLS